MFAQLMKFSGGGSPFALLKRAGLGVKELSAEAVPDAFQRAAHASKLAGSKVVEISGATQDGDSIHMLMVIRGK